MQNLSFFNKVMTILVIVGGLNWGLVGAFNINLVAAIFGASMLARIIYILVGIAAVYLIFEMLKTKKQ